MALPVNRPLKDDTSIHAYTSSIGATPVAGTGVAMSGGRLVRASAVSVGAATGTITITVATPLGTVGTFTLTGGVGTTGFVDFGATAANADVNEGDAVTFTPSGGGGATIPGLFTAVVR